METLLARTNGIEEIISAHIGAMERDRRLADEVVTALRATGINRAMVPTELGGDDVPLVDTLELLEHVASVDGSTGWCAAIGAGSNLFAGYLPKDTAATVWADPDQGNASMFGPYGNVRPSSDGFTLEGRWPFCSNSLHSKWIGVAAFWFGDDDQAEPMPRLVFVPIEQFIIEPTWDAPGLCGTGSHHASLDGVAVSRDQSLTFMDAAWADGVLWRLPMFCTFGPQLAVVVLGIARGALAEIAQRIVTNVGSARGALAEDPVGLADFAQADTALRSARAGLFEVAGQALALAQRHEAVPRTLQAQVMMATNHCCEVAVDVTSTAHRLGGAAAAYADSSLLRRLRDVETARQHIIFSRSHRPAFAKVLAGEDLAVPPYIV